jgi:hypothetical protein
MTIRIVRDWRGLKYKISECSTDELLSLMVNAQHTYDEVARFIEEIDAELVVREMARHEPYVA